MRLNHNPSFVPDYLAMDGERLTEAEQRQPRWRCPAPWRPWPRRKIRCASSSGSWPRPGGAWPGQRGRGRGNRSHARA